MAEGHLDSKRFVPSGVDAQSWLGFEHRIQERRFKALLETITTAVARRDGVAARVALEEARELRPAAPELEALSARVALLPLAAPSTGSTAYGWYRGLGAVAMFGVGVGLVIGIESLRPATSGQAPVATIASAAPRTDAAPPPLATAVADPSTVTPAAESAPALVDSAAPAVVDPPAVVETPLVAAPVAPPVVVTTPKREEPVGTAGVSRASTVDARPAAVPNRSTFRPTAETGGDSGGRRVEPSVQAGREIPDNDVATSTRSENRPGPIEVSTPPPAIAANVIPQPVSVTAPPPALPATTTAAAVSAATVRSDNTRVAQVLNQYARAYGQLDPTAARAVWPTVDERALTRAFASLESQDVSFDRCDIDVKGNLASASCRGTASYVGKVGSRQARTEPRQWNFELKLHGDDWKIEKAQATAR
jgi:hypothetical protein